MNLKKGCRGIQNKKERKYSLTTRQLLASFCATVPQNTSTRESANRTTVSRKDATGLRNFTKASRTSRSENPVTRSASTISSRKSWSKGCGSVFPMLFSRAGGEVHRLEGGFEGVFLFGYQIIRAFERNEPGSFAADLADGQGPRPLG